MCKASAFGFSRNAPPPDMQVVGYVKNLPDGRVESYAEGTENAVSGFMHDLTTGPTYAKVADIEEIVLEPSNLYPMFRIEK